MQQRLGEGVDSNQKDGDGETALTWASWNGHLAVVEALLAHGGCDVNHKTENGNTAFTFACCMPDSVPANKAKIQRLLQQHTMLLLQRSYGILVQLTRCSDSSRVLLLQSLYLVFLRLLGTCNGSGMLLFLREELPLHRHTVFLLNEGSGIFVELRDCCYGRQMLLLYCTQCAFLRFLDRR